MPQELTKQSMMFHENVPKETVKSRKKTKDYHILRLNGAKEDPFYGMFSIVENKPTLICRGNNINTLVANMYKKFDRELIDSEGNLIFDFKAPEGFRNFEYRKKNDMGISYNVQEIFWGKSNIRNGVKHLVIWQKDQYSK